MQEKNIPWEESDPPANAGRNREAVVRTAAERQALNELFSLTYEELRRLASSVKRGDPSATLNPTALVNEAWLKLAKSPGVASD